jgi:hypothetical protein
MLKEIYLDNTLTHKELLRIAYDNSKFRFISKKLSTRKKINKINELLLDFLKDKHGKKKAQLLDLHKDTIIKQAFFNTGLTHKKVINQPNKIKEILEELENIIIAIECEGIFPYDKNTTIEGQRARNFVKYLLHDIELNKDLANWKNFKNIFIKKNESFLKDVKDEFQNLLLILYKKTVEEKNHHEKTIEMLIGHILSTYVLTEPKKNECLKIPQKIDGQWKLIPYFFNPIPLTSPFLRSSIYAYGLLADNKHETFPIIIFQSTPHPTGKSSLLAMITNFTPGFAVGKSLYLMGKKKLEQWVKQAIKEKRKKIKVYGQSLGGSLSYHLAMDFPEYIEIHAYVPAGILKRYLKKCNKIKGTTFSHKNDFVNLVNKHPEEIQNIRVLTEKPRKNPLIAHMRIFGCEKTILLRINTQKDNKRFIRSIFSIIHQTLAFPLFLIKSVIFLLVLPIKLLIPQNLSSYS